MAKILKPTLIHIGLHKTASSTMQTLWHNDPQIALAKQFCDKIAMSARKFVNSRHEQDLTLPNVVSFFDKPSHAGAAYVFSSEALSTYVWGVNASREDVAICRSVIAQIFSQLVENPKILIVVRDPISWLVSIHRQFIQQGGCDTFARFVIKECEFLAESLSLRNLCSYWGAQFGSKNILLLPYELFRDDSISFFSELKAFSGTPIPSGDHAMKVNSSINGSELEFMRQAARQMAWFIDNVTIDETQKQQFNQIRSQISLLMRRELQHNKKGKMARFANRGCREKEIHCTLPDPLALAIVTDFIGFLEERDNQLFGYLAGYKRALGL